MQGPGGWAETQELNSPAMSTGGPEDVCSAGRLRLDGHHGADCAEHARRLRRAHLAGEYRPARNCTCQPLASSRTHLRSLPCVMSTTRTASYAPCRLRKLLSTAAAPSQVDSVKSQLDAVLLDIGADVVKTGMLPSAEVMNGMF